MAHFGFSSKEIVGKTIQDVFPEIWETVRPYCENALMGEESHCEVQYKDRDLANTFIPVKGMRRGRRRQGMMVTQDVTHKKAAEQEKAKLERELHQSQKMEAIGQLAGGVSHDLNNLLTPILGFGQLLLEDCEPDHPTHEYLAAIVQSGFRARDLVRQLLAFSRKQTLQYTAIDLNKAVSNFQKLLRHTIREDIAISFVPGADIQMVLADIGQIEQVIMNLAVNAQDAMDKGGRLTIETQMAELDPTYMKKHPGSKPGPHVMLAVSDTGCGMDPKTQSRIFEPFFSTKGDQGTGLGLATVYGIVKQHGGNIWLYSEPDKGTTFKIYLPVSRTPAPAHETETVSAEKLMGKETILLVEDSEPVRRLAQTILLQHGYTVNEAENGGTGPEASEVIPRPRRSAADGRGHAGHERKGALQQNGGESARSESALYVRLHGQRHCASWCSGGRGPLHPETLHQPGSPHEDTTGPGSVLPNEAGSAVDYMGPGVFVGPEIHPGSPFVQGRLQSAELQFPRYICPVMMKWTFSARFWIWSPIRSQQRATRRSAVKGFACSASSFMNSRKSDSNLAYSASICSSSCHTFRASSGSFLS